MKSQQTHKVALLDAIRRPLRTCCARETMSSIRDSSHKLLSDEIYAHEMAVSQNGPYEIQESRILRKDGDRVASEFIFVGIRENVRDSKSLKGINRTIVEEAATVSQDSLDVFIPTVMGRVEDSQMWFIWNPELTTDPVFKLLRLSPPSNTIHIHTNYLENPWLTDTMRTLADDLKRTDPKKYAHIWMGEPITEVEGAIFAAELQKADAAGAICSVPYDPMKPVYTAWDLGYGDPTCIWFIQRRDGFLCFIDYMALTETTLTNCIIALNQKGYMYDEDHLPHDAVDSIIHAKLIGNQDKTMSIESIMRSAGRKVRIGPKLLKPDALNAGRTLFPLCRFDAVKCADGIQALRHYQWDRTELEPGKRKPLHDQYSHGADAFLTAAVSIKREKHAPAYQAPQAEKYEIYI